MRPRPGRRDDIRWGAIGAALLVVLAMFLPWYEKSVVPTGQARFASTSLSAFGAFTWIEAAILLVDVAMLALLAGRLRRRPIVLPAADGTLIAAGGCWIGLLLAVRAFDRPSVSGTAASVGLEWGMLVALLGAAGLVTAGVMLRRLTRPAAAAPPTSRTIR